MSRNKVAYIHRLPHTWISVSQTCLPSRLNRAAERGGAWTSQICAINQARNRTGCAHTWTSVAIHLFLVSSSPGYSCKYICLCTWKPVPKPDVSVNLSPEHRLVESIYRMERASTCQIWPKNQTCRLRRGPSGTNLNRHLEAWSIFSPVIQTWRRRRFGWLWIPRPQPSLSASAIWPAKPVRRFPRAPSSAVRPSTGSRKRSSRGRGNGEGGEGKRGNASLLSQIDRSPPPESKTTPSLPDLTSSGVSCSSCWAPRRRREWGAEECGGGIREIGRASCRERVYVLV